MLERWEVKAEQHVFQLKMKPQLDSGLHSPDQITLFLARDQNLVCSRQTYSPIPSANGEYKTACNTILTTVLLRDPGKSRFALQMRNQPNQCLSVSGKI